VRTPSSDSAPPAGPDPPAPAGSPPELALPSESFSTLLVKEIERSRRYYRGFGLVRVRWNPARTEQDRFDGRREPASRPTERGLVALLVEAVARTVRRADVVAPAPSGGLYVLLPETPASGIPVVSRRIGEVLQSQSPQLLEIGQAAYPRDGETSGELLEALWEPTP
jgi:hypothetical protein